jgi:hypothetical protein
MLLHNDVTALPDRAAHHEAPLDGYARYLFLLELSHLWGPALRIPGDEPDALVGFPFHWSFWMDAGGSPAGGNVWTDNLDGTFTTDTPPPAEVRYSLVDLYCMGLAGADEVPPFGLLVDAVAPPGTIDPLFGDEVSAETFPWFAVEPVTVTATRRALTVDDVIEATGVRDPATGASQDTWTLGVVLVVPADATDDQLAAWSADFEPIASSFAPAFDDATSGRGHLDLVTQVTIDPAEPDAGAPAEDASAPVLDAGTDAATVDPPDDPEGCGCTLVPSRPAPAVLVAIGMLGLLARRRSRRR